MSGMIWLILFGSIIPYSFFIIFVSLSNLENINSFVFLRITGKQILMDKCLQILMSFNGEISDFIG